MFKGPLGKLNLTITWSVVPDDDTAETIVKFAENGDKTALACGAFI